MPWHLPSTRDTADVSFSQNKLFVCSPLLQGVHELQQTLSPGLPSPSLNKYFTVNCMLHNKLYYVIITMVLKFNINFQYKVNLTFYFVERSPTGG
jgi:hypothetical protein